jgi:hypothetical protein
MGAPPGAVLGSSHRGDREQQTRSSMGVVKRTSTWGFSTATAKEAGLQRRPCVTWLSERQGYRARGRSVAAKAPRSGIERFAGAWIARWLQKSVRSILSAVLVGGRKAHGQPLTSAARRPLPRRGSETDSRRAHGCGTKRAILTSVRGAPLGESRASNRRKAPRTTTASP